MNTRKVLLVIAISMVSAITGVYTYSLFFKSNPQIVTIAEPQKAVAHFASYSGGQQSNLPDLTVAAQHSVHAVVHVKTMSRGTDYYSGNPLYEFFFGPRGMQQPQPVMGSGSGVIITTDGYIVTNNHVIDNAQEIEVVLNDKRSFSAKLVGTDPATDIALLKIDEEKLPYLTYGDSDDLKVGEWVLAVGNPFNLTSTVTAGIVSAKARSINILANRNQPMGIESFIQTDAAVNPGNSGGALVNQKGQLVGINTAIASRTGSFSGYSFAVPVSIAKKVVADLMEFGEVQRGILGVQISDVNKEVVEKFDLDRIEGIFVIAVTEGGGAEAAGIKAGDVIMSVEGEVINSVPELQERISRRRPGDKVNLLIKRDGEKKPFVVTLRNIRGTTSLIKSDDLPRSLGAEIQEVSNEDKRRLQIRAGVQVVKLYNGKLKQAGIKEGYIVTKANRVPVTSVEDFKKVVSGVDEGLFLTGIYPNGRVAYYGINLED
ncbi:Do family serine endopeptidase [Marinilabiliaceae bacterium JC017]|nr:Do family serine endopeptidase [Marinilabiliaceae bacterium JC017]